MAYAFDESGSLQNTGSANFFGSRVCPICELLNGRPTNSRFDTDVTFATTQANRPKTDGLQILTNLIRQSGES